MATGIVDRARRALEAQGCVVTVFTKVVADPPDHVVLDAATAAGDATGVIGIGGGSSLDVAKLVAALNASDQPLGQMFGVSLVTGGRLPLVLVPTTAGTGSEVTPISIVTTGASEKMGVVSPVLLPDLAVLDPDLTLGLPAPVTAATGIDAMVHAIEAYASTSPNNNPLSKALACEALRLMGGALLDAVNGVDDARGDMLLGSMLAGQAFANSPVAAVHALAYPIGGHFHIAHGLSNALVLPHVLRFNAEYAPYGDLVPYAFPGAEPTADSFIQAIQSLSVACGLPQRLRDVAIPKDALPMMARDAMNQTRLLVNNPRTVTERDALAIYEAAW